MNSIWDSHIHLFTSEMADKPGTWADNHGELIWKACVAPPDRPSIQGWASVDQLLHDMDSAGIEKALLQGWYWENQETCHLQNRYYAELLARHSDRLLAFAAIQARDKLVLEEIDWTRDHGFSGIGEVHAQAQGFYLKSECWQKVLSHIQDWQSPINLHVTDPNTSDHPGKIETPLEDYLDMAEAWPTQVFILAHLGALIPLQPEFAERIKRLKNVYFDCAAIPLLYPSSVLPEMVSQMGSDRILFGTDYPLRTFPREQKQPEFSRNVQFVKDSGLTVEDLKLVFTDNAKWLFQIR
jgi:uncharacterized protein